MPGDGSDELRGAIVLVDLLLELAVPHLDHRVFGGDEKAVEQHKKEDDAGVPQHLARRHGQMSDTFLLKLTAVHRQTSTRLSAAQDTLRRHAFPQPIRQREGEHLHGLAERP